MASAGTLYAVTLYAAARQGAAQVGAKLPDQALWTLCYLFTEGGASAFRSMRGVIGNHVPELRKWAAATSVDEGAEYFAKGLRRVGMRGVAYLLHDEEFRRAMERAGDPPVATAATEESGVKTDKAEAAEDKAEDKVSALVQEWLDADEELAEATSPLDRRVAQKRRDQAARALADAVDDDVISDQLIIDTWPQITAYGRALGWSLKEVLRFLAGPEKSISVPDADDADDAGDDDDDDDGGDGGDDKGDAADDKDGDKDKGEVPAPAKNYAGLRRGEGQG